VLFPLYLYPENEGVEEGLSFQGSKNGEADSPLLPKPNFNPEIIKQIEAELGMELDWQAAVGKSSCFPDDGINGNKNGDQETSATNITPTDLLDYIYAVLHSPTYREKYKEFLKIDFPRIPFDLNNGEAGSPLRKFWKLVKIGSKLRKLHLMEGINPLELDQGELGGEGENLVEKIKFEKNTLPAKADTPFEKGEFGKVWINDTKYFENVPENVWDFYIGGYQPAQKWLKDRKDRELSFDDILHYQKILWVLSETERLMTEVDNCWVVSDS
jgi:hypothetical protein